MVGVTVPQDGGADVATRKVLLENVDTGAEEWTPASDLLQAALGNDGHALAALAVQLDADGWRVRGCACCSRLILQSGIRAASRRSDSVFSFPGQVDVTLGKSSVKSECALLAGRVVLTGVSGSWWIVGVNARSELSDVCPKNVAVHEALRVSSALLQ